MKINKIRPQESGFTEVSKKLAVKVEMLYFYGKLPENVVLNRSSGGAEVRAGGASLARPKCVAIVGSRKNTAYGYEVAYRAAYEAAKAGAVVISGLAYGIDSVAHRGALDAGGVTVAVLGTPIDRIYPAAHRGLAREIIEKGGAILSEYGPGDFGRGPEAKTRFLARNRIIAGLSDAVLVAEAASRSGTLNTAMHALDTGVDLLAAPGDITRATSAGCNKLLSQGAIPYTEPADLLDLLFPARGKKQVSEEKLRRLLGLAETEVEKRILELMFTGVSDGDEIVEKLRLSASEFSQAVTMLEIKGVVKALGANLWMLH